VLVHAFILLLISVAVKSDNFYKIRLKLNLSRQNIRPHAPITGEAVEGVFEGGGAVVLEEKVAYPCEGVALDEGGQHQPAVACYECRDKQSQGEAGAHKMQAARGLVAVFAEVEGVKLSKAGEFLVCGCRFSHVVSPYKSTT
jgi:hypothetical protein